LSEISCCGFGFSAWPAEKKEFANSQQDVADIIGRSYNTLGVGFKVARTGRGKVARAVVMFDDSGLR
jgi:hypothetical protein